LSQFGVVIQHRFVTVAAVIHIYELTGEALAYPKMLNGERHIAPQTGEFQP
jgi:hypothetical protein